VFENIYFDFASYVHNQTRVFENFYYNQTECFLTHILKSNNKKKPPFQKNNLITFLLKKI